MQGIEGACQASRVACWPGLQGKMQRRKPILGFQTQHLAHFTSAKWAQEGSPQRVSAGEGTAGQTGRKAMSSLAVARMLRFGQKVLLLLLGMTALFCMPKRPQGFLVQGAGCRLGVS